MKSTEMNRDMYYHKCKVSNLILLALFKSGELATSEIYYAINTRSKESMRTLLSILNKRGLVIHVGNTEMFYIHKIWKLTETGLLYLQKEGLI